ncbi:MAG: ATP synthase F0 subunit A [Gemmataceae bacterium]
MFAAANPFDHVIDQKEFHIFDHLFGGVHIPLPAIEILGYRFQLTKFMVLEVIAAVLVVAIYVPLARRAQAGGCPRGYLWNAFESILTFIRDQVARPCIGEHDADRFLPFLWSLFLFILFCNLLGMLPYLGSPTGSLSVTGALALCSFVTIHGSAIAKMGPIHYLQSYVPHTGIPLLFAWPIVLMIVGIELVGHVIKAFVLAVRLFANMFAGHMVLATILTFIVMAKNAGLLLFSIVTIASVLGVVALSLLELFVAFLHAFIFTFLTSLFLGSVLHPEH